MLYEIIRKDDISENDYLLEVYAPQVAEKFKPGNFTVLLTVKNGERIPMSIKEVKDGSITMFIKKLGKTSLELRKFNIGDTLEAVIGPMGTPPEMKKYGNVLVCSDLVCGHAENYAISAGLKKIEGNNVISIQSFPSDACIYPESQRTENVCDKYILSTVNGETGRKGHYTEFIKDVIEEENVDTIFAGGDIPSLKRLSEITKPMNIPTIVTVRQIMIDATGMCGSCRVFLDGEMKLTCIDGPMFDAHKLNFDDIINRLAMFKREENKAKESYLVKQGA